MTGDCLLWVKVLMTRRALFLFFVLWLALASKGLGMCVVFFFLLYMVISQVTVCRGQAAERPFV